MECSQQAPPQPMDHFMPPTVSTTHCHRDKSNIVKFCTLSTTHCHRDKSKPVSTTHCQDQPKPVSTTHCHRSATTHCHRSAKTSIYHALSQISQNQYLPHIVTEISQTLSNSVLYLTHIVTDQPKQVHLPHIVTDQPKSSLIPQIKPNTADTSTHCHRISKKIIAYSLLPLYPLILLALGSFFS